MCLGWLGYGLQFQSEVLFFAVKAQKSSLK